jgi:hypothetical protein
MKASFNFSLKNVSVSEKINLGEVSLSTEIEYTETELLRLIDQAGEFYAWFGGKIEPIIEVGTALAIEAMKRGAAEVAADETSL